MAIKQRYSFHLQKPGQRFLAKASSREPSKDTMDLVATTEVAGGGPRSSAQVIAIAKVRNPPPNNPSYGGIW